MTELFENWKKNNKHRYIIYSTSQSIQTHIVFDLNWTIADTQKIHQQIESDLKIKI